MPEVDDRPRFLNALTITLVAVTTVPGWLQAIVRQPPRTVVLLTVVAAAMLLVSIAGMRWAERRPGSFAVVAMLAAYTVTVLLMMWLSDAAAFLVAMPLVSMLVLFLPFRVALAWIAGLLAILLFTVWSVVPQRDVWLQACAGFATAFIFVAGFSLIARRERYARRDVERLSAQLETLATTRERNRIAREIHDSLGHYLTAANVQLEAARGTTEGREERLDRVQSLLRDGLGELRRSVSMLREALPTPQPFTQAIGELVDECRASGLMAELSTTGAPRPLPGAIGFTLYRATQEALTNVQRHARAKRVAVDVDYLAEKVKLSVRDDGVGAPAGVTSGNGLSGLRERVELVGGTVSLGSSVERAGFSITIEVPG